MSSDRPLPLGIPIRQPDRATAASQYLNRSSHKLRLAEYHAREFERLEDELTWDDFVDFEGEAFVAAQAHADGVLQQLAAAFDAFACAVAHRYGSGRGDPDRSDFARDHVRLADAAGGELGAAMKEIGADKAFAEVQLYRNLAAHRGVLGEQQHGGQDELGREQVRLLLPAYLPDEFPDFPGAHVRPILRRYLEWARPQIAGLLAAVPADEVPAVEPAEQTEPTPEPDLDLDPDTYAPPTAEQLAPTFGEWKAWYSSGSFDFGTQEVDLPAWFLRRGGGGEILRLDAVGIDVDVLGRWLVDHATDEVAKAVMRHYRPRQMHGTAHGTILIPALT